MILSIKSKYKPSTQAHYCSLIMSLPNMFKNLRLLKKQVFEINYIYTNNAYINHPCDLRNSSSAKFSTPAKCYPWKQTFTKIGVSNLLSF